MYKHEFEIDIKVLIYASVIKLPDGGYQLKKGKYVLLLFLGDKGILFTTLRSKIGMYGLDKEEYYKKHLNEEFQIVIKKE